PPGGNFRPPQSSQVHSIPVAPRPQTGHVSAAAPIPSTAQGQGPAAPIHGASTPAASVPPQAFPARPATKAPAAPISSAPTQVAAAPISPAFHVHLTSSALAPTTALPAVEVQKPAAQIQPPAAP
ncbi:hypothetical protein U1Q18_036810, partial [Sarracenia purpurea var. burkii]